MLYFLIGVGLVFVIWLAFFYHFRNLRKRMIWNGIAYAIFTVTLFIIWAVLSRMTTFAGAITPGYWDPDTVFNLVRITGGLSTEDVLFMFIAAGLIVAFADLVSKYEHSKSAPRRKALYISVLSYVIFGFVTSNLVYPLILSAAVGGFVIWIERKDLIRYSITGGVAFMIFHFVGVIIFSALFPDFLPSSYTGSYLARIFGIPLEEALYAFTFGMMWAPMYEYFHGGKSH